MIKTVLSSSTRNSVDRQPEYPRHLTIETSSDDTKAEMDALTRAIMRRYPHVESVTFYARTKIT